MRTPRRDRRVRVSGPGCAGGEAEQQCQHPDCNAPGSYRAPRSREPEDGHFWFCLDHVREYNAAWDFFAGMNQAEIEAYQRNNATWHRPTWPLGGRPGGEFAGAWVKDDLGLLSELGMMPGGAAAKPPQPADPRERAALAKLDLDGSASLQQIKTRYKELVKRYHPDANGGDTAAEERLKEINQAYSFLLSCGYD
jgi:hypothetical protein